MKYLATCSLLSLSVFSQAAVLSGTGINLPIGGVPHGPSPGVPFVIASGVGTYTGTWSTPAAAPWIGTATATGVAPLSGNSGISTIDFTPLTAGFLPAGSMLLIGDIDVGFTESTTVKAYDAAGLPLSLWLDEPTATYGSGTGVAGAPEFWNAPSWVYDATLNTYEFHGGGVGTSSPNLGVVMLTNQDIYSVDIDKAHAFNSLTFRAPEVIPEPSSVLLTSCGILGLLLRRARA